MMFFQKYVVDFYVPAFFPLSRPSYGQTGGVILHAQAVDGTYHAIRPTS